MNIPPNLLNEHFQDRYFDVVNAIEEAKHIYFEGNRIFERLALMRPQESFQIGELGFGAGRVLVSLVDSLERSGLEDLSIQYNSVELHPVSHLRMKEILAVFQELVGPAINCAVDAYSRLDISKPGWQETELEGTFGRITLRLWIGEALEMVQQLKKPCHAWFLDGHGPKKNPLMWRPELLNAVAQKTMKTGTVATYSVAGHVRRDLASAGFTVEKVQGFGGKNSVLRGEKNENNSTKTHPSTSDCTTVETPLGFNRP